MLSNIKKKFNFTKKPNLRSIFSRKKKVPAPPPPPPNKTKRQYYVDQIRHYQNLLQKYDENHKKAQQLGQLNLSALRHKSPHHHHHHKSPQHHSSSATRKRLPMNLLGEIQNQNKLKHNPAAAAAPVDPRQALFAQINQQKPRLHSLHNSKGKSPAQRKSIKNNNRIDARVLGDQRGRLRRVQRNEPRRSVKKDINPYQKILDDAKRRRQHIQNTPSLSNNDGW